MTSNFQSSKIEEARIHAAYAKRNGDGRYSWFSPGHLFMIQERERVLLDLFRTKGIAPLEEKRILDVGCGTGYWLRQFINWGARPQNITGVDLLSDRIIEAKNLCPETMRIECGSAAELRLDDSYYDLVLQSMVFSSILDQRMKQHIASEMLRVVKADGAILWYDFHVNNPVNSDVEGIKKQEIFRLFPGCKIELWRITLAPPLVRFLAPCSWILCYLLGQFKIFNTHYLGIIRKADLPLGYRAPS